MQTPQCPPLEADTHPPASHPGSRHGPPPPTPPMGSGSAPCPAPGPGPGRTPPRAAPIRSVPHSRAGTARPCRRGAGRRPAGRGGGLSGDRGCRKAPPLRKVPRNPAEPGNDGTARHRPAPPAAAGTRPGPARGTARGPRDARVGPARPGARLCSARPLLRPPATARGSRTGCPLLAWEFRTRSPGRAGNPGALPPASPGRSRSGAAWQLRGATCAVFSPREYGGICPTPSPAACPATGASPAALP